MADPSPTEWVPHAEKEFGRFTHALSKSLPSRLAQMRRTANLTRALAGATPRKVKG